MARGRLFHNQPQFVVEQIIIPAGPRIKGSLFPVRVLVAWLAEPNDIGYLFGDHRPSPPAKVARRFRDLIRAGNRAQSELGPLDQGAVVSALEPEFEEHKTQWMDHQVALNYIIEGWEMKMVHLPNVVSLQPLVEIRKCDAMMSSLHPSDSDGLAAFTLPIGGQSILQVARLDGRYVLRDGYHRAYSLLRSGISKVPALVRDVNHVEELRLPGGLFSEHVYKSTRPPVLADFLHPRLAATIT